MSDNESYDSDAPEEFTAEQGIQQDEVITKVQKENKARVVREGKERRRLWAQRKTPRPSQKVESVHSQDVSETETPTESSGREGMLPNEIVQMLASREKQVFLSDSEDDKKTQLKRTSKKKRKPKSSGVDTVLLNEIPPAQCLQNSLEFLKKRKMQVPRSNAVLKNSHKALRLLSSSGLLK
ncbi:hypothetical protein L484_020296 [Morus notabilis]|uniref:Uncharacterized protein n=1 Tax=Morus notabilis TaxID=981085 RepID=W9QGX9_9ROSA|nr:uncharacterized protein LOC21403199 [Morus notabilis]EXB37237.1 hypothetical protein L484_020296 [Morus notabilis]